MSETTMRRGCIVALRVAFALLALTAIASQLSVHLRLRLSIVNYFSYFTNLSNLLASLVLLCKSSDRWRAVSVVNMAVVGIVFALLLRNENLGSLQPWVNVVLHYIMPSFVALDWLLAPPAARLGPRFLPIMLLFPAAYLLYSLVRGALIGWYPYPFLSPLLVGGAGVTGYAAGIGAAFLVIGAAVLWSGDKRQPRLHAP